VAFCLTTFLAAVCGGAGVLLLEATAAAAKIIFLFSMFLFNVLDPSRLLLFVEA